ncbi:hypothetical protein ACC761_39455, partial [Rhizobium ruizarguesonis]
LVEFSKLFTTDEVWPADILEKTPEYKGKTLYQVLYQNGTVNEFPLSDVSPEYENRNANVRGRGPSRARS